VLRSRSIWTTHIKDSIGRRPIASLSPYDVELCLRELEAKGLSEASVRQTGAMLHRACRLARKWSGNTLPNPIADTELPDWYHEQRDAVRSPELEEVQRLLRTVAALDLRLHAFVVLVAATGLRRGEACALRWNDVDLEAGTVRIDESVVMIDGGVEIRGPKTRGSIRQVAVGRSTASVLQSLRGHQEELARLAECDVGDEDFVFASEVPTSSPPHPDSMSHAFARLRERAGVPADVHLHSLRHFQATVLDPVISEAQKQARLGWSTVHMAGHYTDGIDEEDRRAAEHVERLLGDGVLAPVSGGAAPST
jgi:integrase